MSLDKTVSVENWTIGAVCSAVALVLGWAGQAVHGGWRARGIVADLDEKILAAKEEMRKEHVALKEEMRSEHATVEDELIAKHESVARNTGEALSAIREKMHEMHDDMRDKELWGRDNYVRQPDFAAAMTDMRRQFELLNGKVDKLLDRG